MDLHGSAAHEAQGVQRDDVHHVDVASPGGHHGEVAQARHRRPGPGGLVAQGTAPEVEGGVHEANGHGLVVEAAGHGAHEVRGQDGHQQHGAERAVNAAAALVGEESDEDAGGHAEPEI